MEDNIKTKIVKVWCGINVDGTLSMHSVEPERDKNNGVWISKKPFVNYILYNQIYELMKTASMTFENDPEYFEINMQIPA